MHKVLEAPDAADDAKAFRRLAMEGREWRNTCVRSFISHSAPFFLGL
jgi:hypothetical protein